MKQVCIIHGGDSFATHDEYITFLKTTEIDDPRTRTKSWKSTLAEDLGPDYVVMAPRMPNHFNCRFDEWKIWFERHVQFFEDGIALVGHSQGGIFLAKYLATHTFPKRIGGTFLLAPPYDVPDEGYLEKFIIDVPLTKLAEQGGKVFIYQSKDDPVVSPKEFEKYQAALPTATFRLLDGRGHFNGPEFPELISDVRSLK